MSNTPRNLVTTSEIAVLAGVDLSTVSNWRRRFDGSFPEPALTDDGGMRPKFDRAEILNWLAKNPRVGSQRGTADMDVFAVLDSFRGRFPVDSAMDVVGALVILIDFQRREGALTSPLNGKQIRSACAGQGLPKSIVELVRIDVMDLFTDNDLETAYASIQPVTDLLSLYDSMLARSVNRLSGSAEQTTPDLLSSFLLALAEDDPDGTIYDPTAGYAGLLLAALQQNKAAIGVGVEISVYAAKVAKRRLCLASASATILLANSLLADPARSTRADLVLTDPPHGLALAEESTDQKYPIWEFGTPPKFSADTAWLQHAIAHLNPSGRAIVVTPIGLLSRGGSEAKIRNELVRRGAVHAVITLPGRVRANTSIRLAVWVLGAPDKIDRRTTALLIDAGADDLSALDPAGDVAKTFNAWMNDPAAELDPSLAVSVPVTELLAPDTTLDPKRWLVNPADELTATDWVDRATISFRAATDSLARMEKLPAFSFHQIPIAAQKLSIGDMQRTGAVRVLRGRHAERAVDETEASYPILSVKHVRPNADFRSITTDRTPQSESTATQLVAAGDVVVYPDGDRVRARVWTEPGWILGRFMQAVRVNDLNLLSAEYLAAAIGSPTNARYLTESTIRTHFDLKQFEIAIPTIEVQSALGSVSRRLHEALQQIEEASENLRSAQQAVEDALTSGLVTVRSD